VTTAKPKVSRRSVVPAKASVVPVNSERCLIAKTKSVQIITMR